MHILGDGSSISFVSKNFEGQDLGLWVRHMRGCGAIINLRYGMQGFMYLLIVRFVGPITIFQNTMEGITHLPIWGVY